MDGERREAWRSFGHAGRPGGFGERTIRGNEALRPGGVKATPAPYVNSGLARSRAFSASNSASRCRIAAVASRMSSSLKLAVMCDEQLVSQASMVNLMTRSGLAR